MIAEKPRLLILAGYGGALTATGRVGDVIVAREVINEASQVYPCESGTGRVLTVDRMIASIEEKLSLGHRFQADVCDMESAAVAEICQANGLPFHAVRVISDSADHSLPPTLDRLIVNGQVSIRKVLLAMFREPRLIVEFWKLSRNTRFASMRLAQTLKEIIDAKAHP